MTFLVDMFISYAFLMRPDIANFLFSLGLVSMEVKSPEENHRVSLKHL